jgi:hypothetical protein
MIFDLYFHNWIVFIKNSNQQIIKQARDKASAQTFNDNDLEKTLVIFESYKIHYFSKIHRFSEIKNESFFGESLKNLNLFFQEFNNNSIIKMINFLLRIWWMKTMRMKEWIWCQEYIKLQIKRRAGKILLFLNNMLKKKLNCYHKIQMSCWRLWLSRKHQ